MRYYDRLSAERSFHLFGDWDLKPAVPEFFDPKQADTSNKRTKTSHPYRDRRRDREREGRHRDSCFRLRMFFFVVFKEKEASKD